MSDSEITGSCLCGKARYSISVQKASLPLKTYICHCNRCRHVSGSICVTTASLPNGVEPPRDLTASLTKYESSPGFDRYFCSQCGSHMCEHDERFSEWRLTSGTLDRTGGIIDFAGHIFIPDTLDGGLSPWLPSINSRQLARYSEFPESAEIPLDWPNAEHPFTPPTTDLIHAHCDCKGVNLYIAPPSARSAEPNADESDALLPHWVRDRPKGQKWWLRDGAKKFMASLCVCDSCRLATGAEVQAWAFVPAVDIALSPDGKTPFSTDFGTLRMYKHSSRAQRHFCGTCGATVFWFGYERPGVVDVSVGLFDAHEGALVGRLLDWELERVSWREDGMERAPDFVEGLETGLKGWRGRQHGST